MINKEKQKKLFRITTIPGSLNFLRGQLKFLTEFYNVTAVSSFKEKGESSEGRDLLTISEEEGIEIRVVNMERHISIFKDGISVLKMTWLFIKERPDIIHSFTPKAGLVSMAAGWLARVPVRIHTFTGLIFPTATGFKKRLLIRTDRLICKFATKVIPEGEGVKNDLINYKITKKPLKVIANGNINGIDCEYFSRKAIVRSREEIREELGFTSSDFVYVFIGRIVRDKGINELLTAFKKIQQPGVKLLLLGRFEQALDPISEEDEKYIHGCEDIKYIGHVSDVRDYLFASDVLVLPSYREGFPNSVMQSGAMEMPTIVTDINGSNEIIIDGETGLIIPPQDSGALFQAMDRLRVDKKLFDKMAANARPSIVDRFQQEIVWEALLECYLKQIN
nr:glycosyltransferase family 4 protein [uncultured Carboxylicivirga sp.]